MLKKPFVILIIDVILLHLCILSVFSVRFSGSVPARNFTAYYNTWYFITAVFIILFYIQGLYDFDETDDEISIFFKVFSVIGTGAVSIMALTYLSRAFAFPRTVIFLSYLLMLALISVWRLFVHKRFIETLPVRRTIVYGAGDRFEHFKELMTKNVRRYDYRGGVETGHEGELYGLIQNGSADCVIITDGTPRAQDLAMDLFLTYPGVIVLLMPKLSSIVSGARHHIVLGDVPLIAYSQKTILGRLYLMKRIIDITVSFVGLVFLIPFFPLIAAAIKLTSPGPVFYSQHRVGRHGKLFHIIKFRTMRANAEEETGPTLSSGDDPRVTPLGRLLRRFKIDETPQIINVLKGDMSLVGPRPERPVFVEEFEREYPGYSERKKVLPGITGLAQVNGLYETDPSIKLMYDLLYIHNYHPLLDVTILYKTIQFVLRNNMRFDI